MFTTQCCLKTSHKQLLMKLLIGSLLILCISQSKLEVTRNVKWNNVKSWLLNTLGKRLLVGGKTMVLMVVFRISTVSFQGSKWFTLENVGCSWMEHVQFNHPCAWIGLDNLTCEFVIVLYNHLWWPALLDKKVTKHRISSHEQLGVCGKEILNYLSIKSQLSVFYVSHRQLWKSTECLSGVVTG